MEIGMQRGLEGNSQNVNMFVFFFFLFVLLFTKNRTFEIKKYIFKV